MFANINFIDSIIIIAFLLVTLFIGMRAGLNVKTLDDYIYYYKKYNPAFIGLSLSMVIFGSGTILGTFDETRKLGIIYALASFGYVINSLISAKFIVPKIDKRFEGLVSVCDIFRYFYGQKAEKFAAIIAIIFDIGAASTQLIVIGKLISYFLNLSYPISIIISSAVILTYSCAGGIRAVTMLDALKCVLMLIFIPILANFATFSSGGILSVLKNTPSEYLSVTDHQESLKYLTLFCFFILPTHMFQPIVVQRLLLVADKTISSRAMYIYGLVRSALIWMITVIALSSLIKNPTANFFSTITNSLPPILQGFTIATILIIVMCKADAHLNSSGIILTKNILSNINTSFNNLKTVRFSTFSIGILATCIALSNYSVISTIVFIESLWSACIGLPLIVGILGFKVSPNLFKKYLMGIIPLFFILHINFSYYIPLLATVGGIIIFSSLYLLSIHQYVDEHTKPIKLFLPKKLLASIRNNLPTIDKILKYSTDRVSQVGADYFAFSVFFCVNYTFPYFMWDFTQQNVYHVLILRVIVIILCLVLLLKSFWPTSIKKYFPLYWHFTLLVTLPLITFFILLLENWSVVCLINSVLSIFLLALLTDWLSFIILTTIGTVVAIILYLLIVGQINFPSEIATNYLFIYTYLFSFLIAVIFTRRKEASFDQKLGVAKLLGGVIAHELRTYLLIIRNYTESLKDQFTLPANKTEHRIASKNSNSSELKVSSYFYNIENVLKKSFSFIDILLTNIKGPPSKESYSKYSITECLEYALSNYPLTEKERKLIVYKKDYDFLFAGDKEIVVHIIFNLLNNSLYYSSSRDNLCIEISTSQSDQFNYLYFKDNGAGISQKNITMIFEKFCSINKKGTGLGLSFCKIAMHMMKGDISCNSVETKYTEFVLKFPKIVTL